ncbi:hypothetical protein QZH41_009036, partial [Actinostola sp. cb2023]
SLLPDRFINHWALDGSDIDVNLRDKPGRDARYEVVDGEKALYLTGLNSFAEVPAVAFNPEGFTFMLWIKPLNQSFNFNPFIYSDWYPTATFYVILHVGYKSVFSRFKGLGSSDFLTYYLGISLTHWTHLSVSWNKTLNETKIFYNGTLKQTTTKSSEIMQTTHKYFHLGINGGSWPGVNVKTFHGYMKHLMVFNKTLNAQEIKSAI